MTIYHVHHVVPKHMGGTDDPSNLVKLTIEEHAKAHKKLWEEHGDEYDRIAWLGLAGMIDKQEAIRLTQIENGIRWGKIRPSEETKRRMSEGRLGIEPWNKGKNIPLSDETKTKISEAHKGKTRSKESIEKQRKSLLGKKRGPYKNYNHSASSKAVEFRGKTYPSIAAAQKDTGACRATISKYGEVRLQQPSP